MNSHRMIRPKLASGTETLKYFDKKFHNEFIKNSKSSIEKEFNDKSHLKIRENIENYKSDF